MRCASCGFENPEGLKFCIECGVPLPAHCSHCGFANPPQAKFCGACGTALTDHRSAPRLAPQEPQAAPDQGRAPLTYTPLHLAEKILTSRSAMEGERKQVTVLFADLKASMELLADRDPEEARQLLDPVLERMIAAVHRYEGTVNQIMGDGIMALFGAPIAHEDHAVRACYAALAMQAALRHYSDEVRRTYGLAVHFRVGLNAGEVVVRAIGNDLHMDYSAIGQTVHLAARMEQLATPGSILLTPATLRLVEGLVRVQALGPIPVKGLTEPVEVCELVGASTLRRRLQAAAARGLTRFVGREAELAALRQVLDQAGTGHGQVVTVVGEAGVGKSRLVYEGVHAHSTQGWRVLESASVSYGKATPYFPVVDLLKRYAHVEDADEPRTVRAKVTGQVLTLDETLQETIPALLWLLDVLPDDSPFRTLEPPQRRQRTLEALKRILLRESQVQPLLLVFEDLHWIDAETQALLDSLIDSLPAACLLLLVNYRPEYQHGWGSKTYYTQLRLDPLPPASAEAVLDVLLGPDPSLAPLKRLMIERTEGNPFFLEESVRTLVETGVLVGEPGAYRLAQAVPTLQVPATVQAVLAARIDRLPPEEKQLLQAAAVIGTEMPLPLLQAIAELPEAVLHRGLAHLQAAEFLYETRLFPERAYTFKHALTQQVAYQSLLTSTRQRYHTQLARELEARFPETVETQPELLAHHCTEAGLAAAAVGYWQRAGERSKARSAYVEAVAHLMKGLEVLQTLPDTPERTQHELDMQVALGQALQVTKGLSAPEVGHIYTRARELCQQVGDTPQLFVVLAGLAEFYRARGEFEAARDLGEQFLALAQSQHDPERLAHAYSVLGRVLFYLGEFVPAHAHLEHALAISAPPRDPSLTSRFDRVARAVAHGPMVWVLWLLGYPDQALTRSHAALTYAQELQHAFSLSHALHDVMVVHKLRGEANAAQEWCEAALAIMTEQGSRLIGPTTFTRGWALAAQGRHEEGMAQMSKGLAERQAEGAGVTLAEFPTRLGEAYGQIGQAEEGLRLLAEALAVVDKDPWYEAEMHRIKGELLLRQAVPDAPQAEACFQQALAVARRQQAKSWELRAALSLSRL
jgi:class 3 adenylate cyclase/tetratricopeptide (TPR) repeat protein